MLGHFFFYKVFNYFFLSTKWANLKFDACYSWHKGNNGLKKQDILKYSVERKSSN